MKQLPHISERFSRFLVNLSQDKNPIIYYPDKVGMGFVLVDYALTLIQSGKRVVIHVDDGDVLAGIKAATSGLSIASSFSKENNQLDHEWSSDFYPSQKAIKLGQQYHILSQNIGQVSILHTLLSTENVSYVPISDIVKGIPYATRDMIIKEIEMLQTHAVLNLDYHWLFRHLNSDGFQDDLLREDIDSLRSIQDTLQQVLIEIEGLELTESELKRHNHKSNIQAITKLFDVNRRIDQSIQDLSILQIHNTKNPLNALQIIEHLQQQLINVRQLLTIWNQASFVEWISRYHECHPLTRSIVKTLLIYNNHQSWADVVRYYIAAIDTRGMEYTASKLTYKDALFYLKTYLGDIKGTLTVTPMMEYQSMDGVINILPYQIGQYAKVKSGIVSYQVSPSEISYPRLDNIFIKQRLTDTELVHNARTLSKVLSDRLTAVTVYLNKEAILISAKPISSLETLDWLHLHEYEQLSINSISESLMECFVDQNRRTHFITYGYLLDTEIVTDWIFQTQVIETMEKLGIEIVNVDISYQDRQINQSNLKELLHARLGH